MTFDSQPYTTLADGSHIQHSIFLIERCDLCLSLEKSYLDLQSYKG